MKRQIIALLMLISLLLPMVCLTEEAPPVTAASMLAALKTEVGELTREPLPEARTLIIPEVMGSAVLEASFEGAASVTLLAPDGRRWTLTPSAPTETPEPTDAPPSDPTLQPDDPAEPADDTEPTDDAPADAPETTTAPAPAAPAGVEDEEFTAYVFDGLSVLVFFQADTYGQWSIEADRPASTACLHYVRQEITAPLLTAVNQEAAVPTDETDTAAFSLGTGLMKRQAYPLAVSSFTQNLQARYGDQLQLQVAADNDGLRISQDGATITCDRAGTHAFTATLYLGERQLCTQRYSVSAANTAPLLTGDVPQNVQYKYWDIEYPARMFSFSLADMTTDPDSAQLTWTVALQEEGPFSPQIGLGGLVLTVDADMLTVAWPETVVPQGEYSFVLCAQDDEGGRSTTELALHALSMQRALEQLTPKALSPNDFSDLRAKASAEELTFVWEDAASGAARSEVLTYLQNYADIRLGIAGRETAWQSAHATDTLGKYMAKVTYPRQVGAYTIAISVTTRANAPLAFERQYTLAAATVGNLAPTATRQAASGWKLLLSASESVELLSADAFTDDGDWLEYLVTAQVNDETHSTRVSSLPYTFVPGGYGQWQVTIRAVDGEGLTSEDVTFSFAVIPWYIVAAAGAVILALLAVILVAVRHLTKPQFPAGSKLCMILENGPIKTELQLRPARWKRELLPLDRLLACGETPLLSRKSCEQLGRILIKPHSKGFVLVDKTREKLLQEAHGRIDFDENVYFVLEDVSVTLWLQSAHSK